MNYCNKKLYGRLVFMMSFICYFCTESMTQDANSVIVNISKSLQIYKSNTSLTIKATKAINVMVSTISMATMSKTVTAPPSTNNTSSTTQSILNRKPSSTGETVIMVIFAVLSFIILILVISTLTLVRLHCIYYFIWSSLKSLCSFM